ncbi:uncharacterized protein BDR25DRAFT_348541 [Lindgomyces ingoldianus]|uniref:Uncharacterized protein n=1 Tax=Lindgomyces ingoldianus TaxID=673940 RepID=A0ACB6RGT9_9PLEO|nr:uncharacterized protein BDR25DRAFT_348541 [Lindgomyces ingoldianus]KAF2478275.1 hypothetical protein BDR25DRAFT_348541 [Lindgomyces ingoldianus]
MASFIRNGGQQHCTMITYHQTLHINSVLLKSHDILNYASHSFGCQGSAKTPSMDILQSIPTGDTIFLRHWSFLVNASHVVYTADPICISNVPNVISSGSSNWPSVEAPNENHFKLFSRWQESFSKDGHQRSQNSFRPWNMLRLSLARVKDQEVRGAEGNAVGKSQPTEFFTRVTNSPTPLGTLIQELRTGIPPVVVSFQLSLRSNQSVIRKSYQVQPLHHLSLKRKAPARGAPTVFARHITQLDRATPNNVLSYNTQALLGDENVKCGALVLQPGNIGILSA